MAALREILASFGIEFDSKQLEKGDGLVDQMVSKLAGFGKVVAGAFAVDAILGFTKGLIDEADALREASIGLGLPAKQLQALEFAAGMAGVEVGALRASLARLQKGAAEADGGKGPASAFKKLGLELKNADGTLKNSGQLFEEAGAAIGKIENPTERAGVASEIFGKSYAKLLPLFSEGEEGLKKAREELEALGFAFDDAFLDNADEFNDNLTKLKVGLKGMVIQGLGPLLPELVALSKSGIQATKTFVAWIRQSKIIQAVLVGVSAKGVLGLIGRLGLLKTALRPLAGMILRTFLPLLLLEDFLVFLEGGDSELGDLFRRAGVDADGLRDSINELFATFHAGAMMANGDISLLGGSLAVLKSISKSVYFEGIKFGSDLAAHAATTVQELWNRVLTIAQQTVHQITSMLDGLPLVGEFVGKAGDRAGAALEGAKGSTDFMARARDVARNVGADLGISNVSATDMRKAEEANLALARRPSLYDSPASGAVTDDHSVNVASPNVKVDVHAAPGPMTPGKARNVGKEIGKGIDFRAVFAALVPTPG